MTKIVCGQMFREHIFIPKKFWLPEAFRELLSISIGFITMRVPCGAKKGSAYRILSLQLL